MALATMIREKIPLDIMIEHVYLIACGHPMIKDLTYLRECAIAERDGEPPPDPPSHLDEPTWPTQSERLAAWDFIARWGYQKPISQVEVVTPSAPRLDLSKLTQDELDEYERVQRKMAGIVDVDPVE